MGCTAPEKGRWQVLLLTALIFLFQANCEERSTLRRQLGAVLRSGYFNTLTYSDANCGGFLATAKVQLLGVCYKSLNGYTLNVALMDYPSSGTATVNSTYYADPQCLRAAAAPSATTSTTTIPSTPGGSKSTASSVPTTCTAGSSGVGGYYTTSTVTSTAMAFPASSCSLVTRAYLYPNCSGPLVQTNFYALNLCLQGITKYSCVGKEVTASVCGQSATAVTSTCQPSASGFAQTDAPYEASACSIPATCTNFHAPSASPSSQGSCGSASKSCIYISRSARTSRVANVCLTAATTIVLLMHWTLH